jgi:molybdopterin-containing oxidoreductase family iron-sulfur binding subunit
MNARLGNIGRSVIHTDPIESRPVDQLESVRALVNDMERGRVEMLVILGGNPVFTAPVDFQFAERMARVPLRVHLSLYQDETSRLCHWHLPETHYLEAWSDARAHDGTASIVQPLIEPLYRGRSAHELVAVLTNGLRTPGYEIVRAYWRRHWQRHGSEKGVRPPKFKGSDPFFGGTGEFNTYWQQAVHDGVVPKTRFAARSVSLQDNWTRHLPPAKSSGNGQGLDLEFQPDPTIYDGRFANNGWLQELPKPLTTTTWDNAAIMSPATADSLNLAMGSYAHGGEHGGYHQPLLELEVQGRKMQAPLWIMPGLADNCVTISLGYGREFAGKVGGMPRHPVGFNAYALRTARHLWFAPGVEVRDTGTTYVLACTQEHHLMANREVVRAGTLQEYHQQPRFAADREKREEKDLTQNARKPLTLYPSYDYSPPKNKWGMVIDLTACTGCKACVVACQAENNIPVVGKDQVSRGREMHWLRVDRYIHGPAEQPAEFCFQPVPCMHCENAPCEYVCPVEATVHSAEGLNDMVYQRCVGTRFCSNNCPYKVRRFNFFHYADYATQSLRLQYNPEVTVRSRGVMEKCSYCVQRIRRAQIDAQVQGRSIADGDVLTACQAACPAQAIVFGDINDPKSKVKQWKDSPLHYCLLADLNTVPRTTYLAAVRNPNPRLEAE